MTRAAVISVGTNSCRLLIATGDDPLAVEYHESRGTRLGEGVDRAGRLSDSAVEKTMAVVADYAALARGVDRTYGIGTSALRDAANADAFLERFRQIAGAPLAILSGEDEARCSFSGVLNGLRAAHRNQPDAMTVIDVGGGSTEFAARSVARDEPRVASLQIGAVRLTEKYLVGDPPDQSGVDRCRQAIRSELQSLPDGAGPTGALAAVGGTANAAARMLGAAVESTGASIVDVPVEDLRTLLRATLAMTVEQRRRLRGLPEQRADIFPAGLMIVVEVAARADVATLLVSESDLLIGYLARTATKT